MENGLIHRSSRGILMRSKSEVIIDDLLSEAGIKAVYEQPYESKDGSIRYPDFTWQDAESRKYFYWEHCGMMNIPSYAHRWNEKLKWYKNQDILPLEEGGGKEGTLIITKETAEGGIDSKQIKNLIANLIGNGKNKGSKSSKKKKR